MYYVKWNLDMMMYLSGLWWLWIPEIGATFANQCVVPESEESKINKLYNLQTIADYRKV